MGIDPLLYASLPTFILPHLFERAVRGARWPLWSMLLLAANAASLLVPFIGADGAWRPLAVLVVAATGVTTAVWRTRVQDVLGRTIVFVTNGLLLVVLVGNPAWVGGFSPTFAALLKTIASSNVVFGSMRPGTGHRLMVYVVGIWIASFELNNPIALFLKRTSLMPKAPIEGNVQHENAPTDEPARGRVIGVMERAIVFVLAVTGSLASLGLVLAAKAFARFRQLDDREFAEYVLIGTLVSITGALLVGLVMKTLL